MQHITEAQPAYGAVANKLIHEDRAAHHWYRFVLSFPPHLVRDYLSRFGVRAGGTVLDPFCGTGTTLVECKKLGVEAVGIEAHPMTHFASSVKVDWHPDPDALVEHAEAVAAIALDRLAAEGICDALPLRLLEQRTASVPAPLRSLPDERLSLLLSGSISPRPLHRTLVLLEVLREYADSRFTRHELLALARALVSSIGNIRFGPEVGVSAPKLDAPAIGPWLTAVRLIADDLRLLRTLPDAPATVHHADARQLLTVLEPNSIDAVITSPPYPNEKDYTRTTRLEAVLLGFIQTKADLQSIKRGLVRSNTRTVYKGDDDDRWVALNPEVQRIAADIERRRIELGKTSGFERMYPRVTRLYFGGMARHLAELRTVLRPGAHVAYVVGDQASFLRVMIRTGELLADIGQSLGYKVVGLDLFRTRIATATKEQLREEVVVLRWPG